MKMFHVWLKPVSLGLKPFFIALLKSKTGWKKKQILERSTGFPNKVKNNVLPWFQMLFIPELALSMV